MSVQEQAAQMIYNLSDDNVKYLIDFMKRFMLPKENKNFSDIIQTENNVDFMQELETMRIKAKKYFPSDFDSNKIGEEAMEEKQYCISSSLN